MTELLQEIGPTSAQTPLGNIACFLRKTASGQHCIGLLLSKRPLYRIDLIFFSFLSQILGNLWLVVQNKLRGVCCVTSTDDLLNSAAIDSSIHTNTDSNPTQYTNIQIQIKIQPNPQIQIEIPNTHTNAEHNHRRLPQSLCQLAH